MRRLRLPRRGKKYTISTKKSAPRDHGAHTRHVRHVSFSSFLSFISDRCTGRFERFDDPVATDSIAFPSALLREEREKNIKYTVLEEKRLIAEVNVQSSEIKINLELNTSVSVAFEKHEATTMVSRVFHENGVNYILHRAWRNLYEK